MGARTAEVTSRGRANEDQRAVGHVAVMNGESEEELVSRIQESGDERAKEQLFKSYGGILGSLAYRYRSPLLPHNDAYQVAALGLLKALGRFDGGKGVSFKSFAYPYIEGELKKFYRDNAEMVRLPRRLQRLKREVVLFEESCLQSTGREPGVDQVAEHLDADEDDVIEALNATCHLAPLSLDWCGDEDGERHPLISSLGACDVSFDEVETRLLLGAALAYLPPRLRHIAELRLKKGWTQKMIAEEMGLSQMHVCRLQNEAMQRLGELCFAEKMPA